MYLRHTTVNKDGKTHSYWRLVRSVRRGRKVVQETVAQLGELDAQGRARARRLALRITGRERAVRSVRGGGGTRASRWRCGWIRFAWNALGASAMSGWACRLWRALELDRFCAEHLAEGREQVPWPAMAAILVIARLCEPSSELHIAEDWYRRTALADLLGVPAERVNDDRLYRALDQSAAAQGGAGNASEEAPGRAVRARLRAVAVRRDEHVLRGPGRGQSARPARLQPRPSPRLQAGLHRLGGDAGRHAARLRGVRRQSHRRHDGRGDRRHDGAPLRSGAPGLGDGPRHDQRREQWPGCKAASGAISSGPARAR